MGKHIYYNAERSLGTLLRQYAPCHITTFLVSAGQGTSTFYFIAHQWLNTRTPGKWINYHGRWPPRSPELPLLGFTLWVI
jgi:hypothetical protein